MTDSSTHDFPVSVSLRSVTPADREFLVAVYGGTRAQELSQVPWSEEQKDAFIRWQFERQEEEYNQRYPDARYDVILVDGVPAGRIWVGTDDKQIRLLDIAIKPEFQNRGVGTHLLRGLMAEATETNKALRHMVFVLNDNAHRFYERLGFVVIEDLGGYKHMEWRPGQSQSATT
jgi:ribosomal protein S18 acetylase RimI-like enzyme